MKSTELFSCSPAAVEFEGSSGDERRLVAGEVEHGCGDFFRLAHAADRLSRSHLFISLLGVGILGEPSFDEIGFDATRAHRVRTDISATLFLSSPEEYDGGDLAIEDAYGAQRVKLAAGDLVLYPATSLHRVEPVTRGARVASFFWIQSMVRDDAKRTLLFDLDTAIQRIGVDAPEHPSVIQLTGVYHNLLRQWADV